MNLTKRQMLWILVILGAALHLTGLSKPHSVVFDEVHFGKFVSAYCCTGNNFFDIHPPHAKLLIAGAVSLTDYDGKFTFNHIGQAYENTPILAFRIFPALWGILIPIAFFYLISLMGGSLLAAFLGALFLIFDNGLMIQTRVIALDGLLILATLSALVFFLASQRAESWKKQILFWILAGVSAGLAVGTKFTGLIVPALIGLLILKELRNDPSRKNLIFLCRKSIWIKSAFIFTYLFGWFVHFQVLDKPGSGDAFYRNTASFTTDVVKLHKVMFDRNAAITTKHPDASFWWQWPQMKKPLFYWSSPDGDMFFVGNPMVWWGVSLCLILFVLGFFLMKRGPFQVWQKNPNIFIALTGFLLSYLPLMSVTRPLFLYHYLTPLLFALIIVILGLDMIEFRIFKSKKIYFAIIGCVVGAFIFLAPVTFGWSKALTWVTTATKFVRALY